MKKIKQYLEIQIMKKNKLIHITKYYMNLVNSCKYT